MRDNTVIKTMLAHKSIRKYSDKVPSDEIIQAVVQAGQQAPFAYQARSILLSKNAKRNPFRAPLLFTICTDYHKFGLIMTKRKWKLVTNDLALLLLGIQDAAYMAQNMVIAGRSLGLGSCFLGSAIYNADKIAEKYDLPQKVFPLVQLTMGYPAEDPPPRPRYPISFTLFENRYPKLDKRAVTNAVKQMDEGYLGQDYYRKANIRIPLERDRKETFTFDNYSWTEHISRKLGQWDPDPKKLLAQLDKRGFNITRENIE